MAWIDKLANESASALKTRLDGLGAKVETGVKNSKVLVSDLGTNPFFEGMYVKSWEYRGLTHDAAKLLCELSYDSTIYNKFRTTVSDDALTENGMIDVKVRSGTALVVTSRRSDESGQWKAVFEETTYSSIGSSWTRIIDDEEEDDEEEDDEGETEEPSPAPSPVQVQAMMASAPLTASGSNDGDSSSGNDSNDDEGGTDWIQHCYIGKKSFTCVIHNFKSGGVLLRKVLQTRSSWNVIWEGLTKTQAQTMCNSATDTMEVKTYTITTTTSDGQGGVQNETHNFSYTAGQSEIDTMEYIRKGKGWRVVRKFVKLHDIPAQGQS